MAFGFSATRGLQGRRVLVTGHTGFKGSWLCLWLRRLGASVSGFSLKPPTSPNLFETAEVASSLEHDLRGDVRDAEALRRAMALARPELVFHLAAQPIVRASYEDPDITVDTNVMGTLRVMEAVRGSNTVRVFVNVTSDKCYENQDFVWGYREQDPMGGFDPYSASKGCAELLFSAWKKSFLDPEGIAAVSVRAGNVVGGGDWGKDRLIPDCMRAFSKGAPVRIRSPHAIRPWQHVLEPLSGYLSVAARLLEGTPTSSAFNFGPSNHETWTVGQLVDRLGRRWGQEATVVLDEEPAVHEAKWLKLDCSLAFHELGWSPKWSLLNMVEQTVAWYRAYQEGSDRQSLLSLCRSQIVKYEEGLWSDKPSFELLTRQPKDRAS